MRTIAHVGSLFLIPAVLLSCRPRAPVDTKLAELDFSTGDITGTVSWNGAPVSGLPAAGMGAAITGLSFSLIDANGSFRLTNVSPGAHTVDIFSPGCSDLPAERLGEVQVNVSAGLTTNGDVDITSSAGLVTGSITTNGVPVSHPTIIIDGPCSSSPWASDDDGHFAHFTAPGSYTARVMGDSASLGPISFTVVAGQETKIGQVDFPTGNVTGTVSWNGASVSGLPAAGMGAAVTGLSFSLIDANGSFRLTNVSPGAHTVDIFSPGCSDLPAERLGEVQVNVSAGMTTNGDVDITSSAGLVTGSITTNGVPVSHPTIIIDGPCSSSPWASDDNGHFAHFTAPGSYTARVMGDSASLGPISFTVVAGQETKIGQVDFPTGNVTGTVSWNGAPVSGLPAAGISAAITGLSFSLIDANGSFRLTNVSPGAHTVDIFSPGCSDLPAERLGEVQVNVSTGMTTNGDVDITSSAGLVTGSITTNGVPVSHPTIIIDGPCSSSPWASDDNGHFAHFTAPGSYTARVMGDSSLLGSFSFGTVAAKTTDIDILSTPAGIDVVVDLGGGTDNVNGLSLEFAEVVTAGNTTVVASSACPNPCNPPPTGYEVVGARFWDLSTTATYKGSIHVCIHYDPAEVKGDELQLLLEHDAGSGYMNITGNVDATHHVICGSVTSLSPFIVVQPKTGQACASVTDCGTGHCIDGVCCHSACGGGDPGDCQACSVAAGGTTNGVCTPVAAAHVCRPSAGICDAAELCDGASLQCPANAFALAGVVCRASAGACDVAESCTGSSPACPTDSLIAAGTICRASAGICDVAEACTGASPACPADSFVAAGTICQSAANVCQAPGRCSGAGPVCPGATPILGCSLDTTPPVFTNVPGTITAFATSTSGARVTYMKPTATDAVDGLRPVTCTPPSGYMFPVGKSTVSCTATDKSGNSKTVSFTVWVQYQTPTDGTFFLKPIRPDGSSIFAIGRAVPVKFKLTGASAGITNLAARLLVTKISDAIRGTNNDVGDEDGEDADFTFKFRPGTRLYGYRWKTRGGTQGTYQLRADLGDGVVHQVNVSLRTAK